MRGLEVRRGAEGRLRVDVPSYAHDGVLCPVLELPDDLEQAIGRAVERALR